MAMGGSDALEYVERSSEAGSSTVIGGGAESAGSLGSVSQSGHWKILVGRLRQDEEKVSFVPFQKRRDGSVILLLYRWRKSSRIQFYKHFINRN
jgi:hypothetical protein